MEEKTGEKSRIEIPSHSREEREIDILEQLCIWRKQDKEMEINEAMICQQLGIPKKMVGTALKKMVEKGYIYPYQANETIRVTSYGISKGNECQKRHHSVSQFLQYIGVSEETAEQDACRAEHFLTDETVKALCVFVNSDLKGYERVIRNSNLSDRYDPGEYEFMMQIYSMDRNRPRKFAKEHDWYTGNITLEMTTDSGWFELQYADEEQKFRKKLWYKNAGSIIDDWKEAEKGEQGERIPAEAFEYIKKSGESLIEGSLLIALTEEHENPDFWNSCQLEIEIW